MIINPPWLTLTWDVFKSTTKINEAKAEIRLTLTWDVFKLGKRGRKRYFKYRLTLTWDVFKYK